MRKGESGVASPRTQGFSKNPYSQERPMRCRSFPAPGGPNRATSALNDTADYPDGCARPHSPTRPRAHRGRRSATALARRMRGRGPLTIDRSAAGEADVAPSDPISHLCSRRIQIASINARSLRKKAGEIHTRCIGANVDIIAVTETWLDDSVPENARLPMRRSSRPSRHGDWQEDRRRHNSLRAQQRSHAYARLR